MKKRTGKWISLSLATALAFTAAPVTALADQQPTETVETTDTNLGDEETTEDSQPVADTGKTEIDESAERTEETKETEETEGTDTDQMPGTPVEEENTEEEDLPSTVIPEAVTTEVVTPMLLEEVTPRAGAITDAASLKEALKAAADAEDKTVTLTQDIETAETISIPAGVTLDGDGKKITAANGLSGHLLQITNGTVTIRDLTVDGDNKGESGIHAYAGSDDNTTVTMENITIQDCAEAGLLVNGAAVTVNGLKTSGNTWGAVNVDQGAAEVLPAFTLTGEVSMDEDNKIWSESDSKATIDLSEVEAELNLVTMKTTGNDEKTYYTNLESVNSILTGITQKPEGQNNYGDATITLTNDVTVCNPENPGNGSAAVTLPDNVILNGNENTIYASDGWNGTNKSHVLRITDGTVTIQNVTIVGNEDTKSGILAWDDPNVNTPVKLTLDAVTVQNCGNAALQVNSATVTANNLKTSGNAWGAVNVDRASGNNNSPSFTLNGEGTDLQEPTKVWTEISEENLSTVIKGDSPIVTGTPMTDTNGHTYYGDAIASVTVGANKTEHATLADAIAYVNGMTDKETHVTITLQADATINGSLTLSRGNVTIDGKNKTIHNIGSTEADAVKQINGAIIVGKDANNVTIQDMTLNTSGRAKHGIQFYCNTDGKLNNVTVNGGAWTAVMVNGAKVTLTGCKLNPDDAGDNDVREEGAYANIEYGVGSDVNTIPKVTVEDVTFDTDKYFVWADETTISRIQTIDSSLTIETINQNYVHGANLVTSNPDNNVAYTITFDANGGTLDGTEEATYKTNANGQLLDEDEQLLTALPTPERTGRYTFAGWLDEDGTKVTSNTIFESDTTLTAKWNRRSGGGSSSSSSYDGYVSVDDSKNGDVSISDSRADEGDTITITTKPDNGYVVDKVVVEDEGGDKLDVTEKSDNKYTFEMPNGDVTVTVTFKEDTSSDEDEEETKDEETTDETALGFLDVSRNDWFYSAVEYVVNHDVMSGVSDSSFAPNATLTRGMLVQILYNLEDRPDNNGINIFTDVTTDAWYTDAVIWANNENIVSGMGEGIFAPNAEITREQMALMLYNYAQYKGYDVSASAELSAFTDGADVSSWASHAVQWAVAEGLMSGMGNGTLAPQGTATRAEVSSIMMRFMENI
ncbi:MAG TPA: S-layer homology domain-containing protein [Candidatus Anaerotignum merdipullorum]|nr:S-layer homology domain-containing protein [Candidatus Anaerotignum merdipullorum]